MSDLLTCFFPQLPQAFKSEPERMACNQEPCPSEHPSSASLNPREAVHGIVLVLLATKQEERLGQLFGAVREDFWHPGNCVAKAKPSGDLSVGGGPQAEETPWVSGG